LASKGQKGLKKIKKMNKPGRNLRACVNAGDLRGAQQLVDQKEGNVDIREQHDSHAGFSCFMLACHRGDLPMAKLLAKYNANVNLHRLYGKTSLQYACSNGDLPMMKLLVNANRNIRFAYSDLDLAIKSGKEDAVAFVKSHMGVLPLSPFVGASQSTQKTIVTGFSSDASMSPSSESDRGHSNRDRCRHQQ
jgi:ankyrin repeat protein